MGLHHTWCKGSAKAVALGIASALFFKLDGNAALPAHARYRRWWCVAVGLGREEGGKGGENKRGDQRWTAPAFGTATASNRPPAAAQLTTSQPTEVPSSSPTVAATSPRSYLR